MKIGILKTGDIPDDIETGFETYAHMIADMLKDAGLEASYKFYDILAHQFPDKADECDGWMVTGSKFGVYEDHRWIDPLKGLIRDIYAQSIPLVGICFGHQIIATALGGTVEKSDIGFLCGNNAYRLGDALPFMTSNDHVFTIQAMHQDQVTALGPDARLLASSDQCPVAALAYGNNVLSFQGHPEFSASYSRDLIETRTPQFITPDSSVKALADVDTPNQADLVARWIAEFYRGATAP